MAEKLTDEAPRYSLADRIAQWREEAAKCVADIEAARAVTPYPLVGAMYLDGRAVAFERCADEAELTLKSAPDGERRPPTEALHLLKRFVEKLDVILPKVDGIIAFNSVRSGHQTYDGPNLMEEMREAKLLLAAALPRSPAPPEKET